MGWFSWWWLISLFFLINLYKISPRAHFRARIERCHRELFEKLSVMGCLFSKGSLPDWSPMVGCKDGWRSIGSGRRVAPAVSIVCKFFQAHLSVRHRSCHIHPKPPYSGLPGLIITRLRLFFELGLVFGAICAQR